MEEEEKKVETKKEEKKPASKLPMMIGGGIVIVIVLIIGGMFAMKAMSAPSEAAETENGEVIDGEEEGYQATGIYFQGFDAFITCLGVSEESQFTYLKFVPQFEVSDNAVMSEIASKMPIIESKISAVMTDLDWDYVKSEKGRERQAEKLQKELNEILEEGEIIRVYFTTFVAQ